MGSGMKRSSVSPQSLGEWVTQSLALLEHLTVATHITHSPTWGCVSSPKLEPICWPEIWFALDMEQVKYLFNSVHCTFHYSPQTVPVGRGRELYEGNLTILGFLGALEGPRRNASTRHAYTSLQIYVTKCIWAKMSLIISPAMNWFRIRENYLVYSLY